MRWLTFLLLTGWLVASTLVALACKCPRTPSTKAAACSARLVFAGRLVRVGIDRTRPAYYDDFVQVYPFVPSKVWRGQSADTITLTNGQTNCAVSLRAGQSYVVYTHPGGELHICGRLVAGDLAAERRRLDQLFRRRRYQRLPAS